MVTFGGRAGVVPVAAGAGWARPSGHAQGNDLPPFTGRITQVPFGPGPYPPGQYQGGQLGANDGVMGADPDAPKITRPVFLPGSYQAGMDAGTENNPDGWRGGIQGFNDQQRVVDRHAYWDAGTQRTGNTRSVPGNPPNPVTDGPARPDLRTVNRSITWQIGSDNTRNQDDLARAYTWVGEQGSGWAPVYGGVPGLYTPYGSRGGVPYPIVDPSGGQGGPEKVWAGPPHGLHSLTYPDGADTLAMYGARPQMRPVRVDRPSNSPQAGQSFSQTVQMQGGPPRGGQGSGVREVPWQMNGRGWGGGA